MAAITAADIQFRLATTAGTAGNTTAGTAAGSLGKYVSTTQLNSTALGNLFDDVTGQENTTGTTDYRCVFVYNANSANALQNAVLWLSGGDPAGGSTITLAVDTTAPSALGSSTAQADTIANELTAPTAIGSWAAPTVSTPGTALALGTIGAGQVKAFWVRRVTSGVAAVNAETVNFAVTGDTGAL